MTLKTLGLDDYVSLIKEWEAKYGGSRVRRFNLTETRACCVKCGKLKSKMSRHHTGNDLFFARMMPEHFAARYIQFLPEDVAKLCENCHKQAHHLYKPLLNVVWAELHKEGQKIITKEWCEKWMALFRQVFNAWVARPPRKRKRKRKKSGSTTKREV